MVGLCYVGGEYNAQRMMLKVVEDSDFGLRIAKVTSKFDGLSTLISFMK